ncbi:MAG: thiamine pyrophosphate-dependent enzyme [Flavobacteriales bacterium]|nr:thiamine pyrophosphate-dependent enzyme [Flavobacteriales bacterium]
MTVVAEKSKSLNKKQFIAEIIQDYKLVCESREASLLGRKEVLTGKAKFGIFGDGKELAQIAMAKQFKNGDFRSGYYRDQTFMMAIGQLTIQQFFAGLYAHTDLVFEPISAGRQMGGHFSTKALNDDGSWKDLMKQKNSSSDISPTAGQMPRLVGLGLASKMYRNNKELHHMTQFSNKGNEVAFGTIGDASTSEGIFWESINASCVLEIPIVMSVWDDGYGISVPKKYQTTKESISDSLSGMEIKEGTNGLKIFRCKGWDYAEMILTYEEAVSYSRKNHIPTFIHVEEITQPQGHSTSGSHERYKTKERLEWAKEYDCIAKFKEWILSNDNSLGEPMSTEEELTEIEKTAKLEIKKFAKQAWLDFINDIKKERDSISSIITQMSTESKEKEELTAIANQLNKSIDPLRKEIYNALRAAIRLVRFENIPSRKNAIKWLENINIDMHDRYNSKLYSEFETSSIKVKKNAVQYNSEKMIDGRMVLRENFKKLFKEIPELLTFGEDTGKIGGVNQSMEGMQDEFGELRVFDTGIREATIIGQGIGLALRGLRPIAEIQYLDYLLYCLQIMSDDLSTLMYRTKANQKCPLIIRTRGHRLEGVWHAGSPMGGIINLVRGIIVCVPRNMTIAAGFYNTLIKSDDPALVVECLNGYRLKEKEPSNYGEFTVPIGIPEIVKEGSDITVVSYGSTFNQSEKAAVELDKMNISCELIDVQTLLPFDINHMIVESLKKTNKIIFIDEDVKGGATAFMMERVLTDQKGYYHLDAEPVTLTAKDHRPAYGSDGDYFSKPSIDDIIESIYQLMSDYNPSKYPSINI